LHDVFPGGIVFRNLYETLEDFRRFTLRPLVLRLFSAHPAAESAKEDALEPLVLPQPLFAVRREKRQSLLN
jgi:hypothetical protein